MKNRKNNPAYQIVFNWIHDRVVKDELGLGFHPDTPFGDYVCIETGERAFTDGKALLLNEESGKMFELCELAGLDIYEITGDVWKAVGIWPQKSKLKRGKKR